MGNQVFTKDRWRKLCYIGY